mmetsp:Transcript_34021/g.46564  ORF Transcript_34021/g.46564 Transcript_34021/m.46564 type:complete len:337 (-) Transcript_34021:89-1099(-)|eukprot:CAMPEP_0201487730 /NCGR_PEP_ID=MMETSP0151_2-20130828/15195_1 /ASSEMBLY_ACC=CAM_ASM_000257 /TAXON_ID=200890 /ORGANISM="Paramoeba atlantica, Strain 621/1 / CCAP 1560/9" /LENGTH=336 /DNA_ID=CAMNT_0047872867 /DNA_START=38 /DNA_END=1048 /DNA_ORIENTATION=+
MADDGKNLFLELIKAPVMDLVPEPPKPAGQSGIDFWAGVVTVSNEDSVRTAFERLVKNNILSAPVRAGIHQPHLHLYYGFIEMLNLLDFVVKKLDVGDRASVMTVSDVQDKLSSLQDTLDNTPVGELLQASKSSAISFPLNEEFSLYTVTEILAFSGSHRLPILNDHKKVVNVITQTMILRHINTQISFLPPSIMKKPIREFVSLGVDTIEEDARAIKACQLMSEKNLVSLAIVNLSGVLVDVFTVKDLRGIGLDGQQIWRLFMPILVYKRKQTEFFPNLVPSALICAKMDDTFESILQKFVSNRIHRIFVVDDEDKPIHQISLSCILKVVLSAKD